MHLNELRGQPDSHQTQLAPTASESPPLKVMLTTMNGLKQQQVISFSVVQR